MSRGGCCPLPLALCPASAWSPAGEGLGLSQTLRTPPKGTPRDKASPANPPLPTGRLLHTHLGRAALLPALPLAHLQHLEGAQESPGLISTQGNELGSPRRV